MGRPAIDLTNQEFGRLKVLRRAEKNASDGHAQWICECQCEQKNIVIVTSNALKRKNGTRSCGCLVKEVAAAKARQNYMDLTNQIYGNLKAIEHVGGTGNSALWRCECLICGNTQFITTSNHLRAGITKTCGCQSSLGEWNIIQILKQNSIEFEKEKSFNDLKYSNGGIPRFDFYLPIHQRLIEFDGKQHFEKAGNWENACPLEERQRRDQEKNQWAHEHNISLVRIPYWERDNITLDMILGDQYLVKPE